MIRILRRLLLATAAAVLMTSGLTVAPVSASIQVICKGVTNAEVKICDPGYAAVMSTMHWRMYAGHNCTNYVAYQLGANGVAEPKILMGNARDWAANAKKIGYTVNTTPAVGSVGAWPGRNHITYVVEVGAGYIITREDNYPGYYPKGIYQKLKIYVGDSTYPAQFIHFKDLVTGSVPVVSGTTRVGSTLSAAAGTWGPSGVSLGYKWSRDGTSIAGATAKTYALAAADKGHAISATVTGSKTGLKPLSKTAATTLAIAPGILTNSVAPALSGTPKVGLSLAVSTGTWAQSGVSYAYQWLRNGVVIPAATQPTYELVAADLGRLLSARVTGIKDGYTSLPRTTSQTSAIAPGKLTNTVAPTIDGTPKMSSTLTASPGTWAPAGAALAYQWLRDGTPITSATAATYALAAADVGHTLAIRVTGSKPGYDNLVKTSAKTAVVAPGTLTNSVAPAIVGTSMAGKTLKAVVGTWAPGGVVFTYQWLAGGTAIAGATKQTFAPTAAQAAKPVTVSVVASKSGFTSLRKVSSAAATPPPVTYSKAPAVSGKPVVGTTLTANGGTWSPSGVARTYKWLRNGVVISKATKTSYTLTTADLGRKISVRVTGSKAGMTSIAKNSAATSAVKSRPAVKVSVKPGRGKAAFVIIVKAAGVATPTGTVSIKDGTKVVKTLKLSKGKASVTLTKLKRGTHSFTVSYSGAAKVTARTVTAKAKVT